MTSIKDQLKQRLEMNQRSHQRARESGDELSELTIQYVPVSRIRPNPFQPRKVFETSHVDELAQSIKRDGLIQPIVVRPDGVRGYQLISGERRLRAFQQLERTEIPALISPMNDQESAIAALQENLKREDLTDFEIGSALVRIRTLHTTRDEQLNVTALAELITASRPAVYRYLSFLSLPDVIQERLTHTPNLLSGSAALALERWRSNAGTELSLTVYTELLSSLLDELERGLPQRSVVSALERSLTARSDQADLAQADAEVTEVTDDPALTRRVKPQKLLRSGRQVGRRSDNEREIKITLRRGELTEHDLERLEVFLKTLRDHES